MKTVTCTLLAFLAAGPAFAGAASDMMKKATTSESGQNYKAQALAKIGMDVTASPAGAKAYIISPANGATVSSPVKVQFGLTGMGIAPAGVQKENTGHHHLLIDNPVLEAGPMPANNPQVVHFGGGQTEAMVTLKPGKHTLQLMLGDWKHAPHSPAVASETITITVK